jgi:hypothetical protein
MFDFAYTHPVIKKIGATALLAVGFFLLGFIVKITIRDFPIWFSGQSVFGVVDEMWYELIEQETNNFNATYFMSYKFTSQDGEVFTGSTKMSDLEWSGFARGDQVAILYSPTNPANNRLDDSRLVPLVICSYIPFLIFIWVCISAGIKLVKDAFQKIEPKPWLTENLRSWCIEKEERQRTIPAFMLSLRIILPSQLELLFKKCLFSI